VRRYLLRIDAVHLTTFPSEHALGRARRYGGAARAHPGVVVGNVFDLGSREWLDFIATFASIVLTFLAGMEVDPAYMRRRLEASVGIGVSSFAGLRGSKMPVRFTLQPGSTRG
jgi:hypothetical protein